MSTTPPTPKPTVLPWHEAAAQHLDEWIKDSGPVSSTVAEIIAKHDPANARPIEFRPGQVWRKKDGETRTIIKVSENHILWRWTSEEFHGCVYDSTYKQMVRLVKSSQLIANPHPTTPAPTSGLDHTHTAEGTQ